VTHVSSLHHGGAAIVGGSVDIGVPVTLLADIFPPLGCRGIVPEEVEVGVDGAHDGATRDPKYPCSWYWQHGILFKEPSAYARNRPSYLTGLCGPRIEENQEDRP